MLERLHIQNLALIEDLELKFGPGLNVITGETGAGKSILVDAIALALGERPHTEAGGRGNTIVQAELDVHGVRRSLRREVKPSGRTRAWIDNNSSTITTLRDEVGKWVDLTAQREGATLLDSETHLRHLDRLAGLEDKAALLETCYYQWQTLQSRLDTVEVKIQRLRETDELANFQLEEIDRFSPQVGEDQELDLEIKILEGAESLIVGLSEAVEVLDQGNDPVTDRIACSLKQVNELALIDPQLQKQSESIEQALQLLHETARDLGSRRDTVQLDPQRLEELRERRGHLSRLVRKYGGSMDSLLETLEDLKRRESGSEELQREADEIHLKLDQHLKEWEKLLKDISKARVKAAPLISGKMMKSLKKVGIENPRFELVWVEEAGEMIQFPLAGRRHVGPRNGWDRVEFRVSFNPGQPLKPLQNVASGGELSRVMLLLKGLSPPELTPPVLIFDEIDTGISGRTARQVGLRLKELAKKRQVLLVTHLPQIAGFADHHLVVEKIQSKETTRVMIRHIQVGSDEQVEAVARLVGGENVTDAARAGARELIKA